MIVDEGMFKELQGVQKFMERIKPVTKLLDNDKPHEALDRLQKIQRRRLVPERERWLFLLFQGLCYREIGEKEKSQELVLASVNSKEGQPLFMQMRTYSGMIFYLYEMNDITDARMRELSFGFNSLCRDIKQLQHSKADHAQHQKIRIGYLASRFDETVLSFFDVQLLAAYDRSRFEVYCYCCEQNEADRSLAFIKEQIQGFYVAPFGAYTPPADVAARINADGIDILFDLEGHTGSGFGLAVAAFKPAPVQICGIGFMGTTGLRAMDYFLGDPFCDPPGLNEEDFCEEILRLPHSHFCYTPSERALHVERTYQAKQPGDKLLLASFANLRKVTDRQVAIWIEILQRLPEAQLLLRSSDSNRHIMEKVRRDFQAQGIDMSRLLFELPDGSYLDRYQDVDILLDTYPYVGGGTTCDALYMGVPVISMYGRRHGTRFGYSLLKNTGIEELAVASAEEYVEKTVALARDTELLAALHQRIPQMFRQSPVMDAAGYMRDIQAAYEGIWRKWLEGTSE